MTALTTLPAVTVSRDRARRLRALTKRRDELDAEWRAEIVQAIEEGGSLREVAELVGLSNPGVMKIRDREGRKPGS